MNNPTARWEEALKRLDASRNVVLDLETSGLDWKRNHVVGWVLTFGPAPQDSYYLPVRHKTGNLPWGRPITSSEGWAGDVFPVERVMVQMLERQGMQIAYHNGGFDMKFLWRLGLQSMDASYEDTMINAPLINEWQGKFSLEACAQVAKVQAKLGKEMKAYLKTKFPNVREDDLMGHLWELDGHDPVAVDYACGDGTSTWQLRDWQHEQIERQELATVHNVESRLLPVLVRMSCHGIKVDVEQLERQLHDCREQVSQLLNHFPSGFNSRSPGDVQAWMQKHGCTDWPLTPKKQKPSFPESWLLTHEAGKAIVEIRRLQTLLNTFFVPMHDRHLFNGRVHPNYHQLRNDEFGTITGRLSCTDPNLQAASKRNEEIGRKHRSIFVADKGKLWTSADYRQCEPVLLAVYSRCKVLLDGFRAVPPVDAHQAVADATGLDRQTGKRVNQTLITGGGKGVIVAKYGVPASEVDRIWDDYFRAMPEIRRLQKRSSQVMRARKYVKSLLGRRARLLRPGLDYQSMNRLLQCGNADIVKLKMVEIDDYLRSEGRPMQQLNNVHDSIDFQHPYDDTTHIDECLRIMTDFGPGQVIELDCPLGVDVDSGWSWAEATFGEE